MNRRLFVRCLVFLTVALSVIVNEGMAREIKGENFDETMTQSGKALKLVGVGIRKKLIINVYLGALYLETPTQNPENVIQSDQVKRVEMRFLYKEVKPEQLVEAWNEGFQKNSGNAVSNLREKINTFNGYFTESMLKGDRMSLTYTPGIGTDISIKGKTRGIIEGNDFMQALFSIWFGANPPSDGLKEGMLGK